MVSSKPIKLPTQVGPQWVKSAAFLGRFLSLAALSLWQVTPALAQTPIPPYSCRNGLFAVHKDHSFQLGRIQGVPRTYFFKDDEGCPNGKGCQTPSYLVPGDQVILNQIQGDWACVWYPGKSHETVGWVPRKQLVLAPAAKPAMLKDWIGHWRFAEVSDLSLTLTQDKQALILDGLAFWYGAVVNGDRVVHTGDIGKAVVKPVKPMQNRLSFKDGDESWSCKIEMTLLPPYLLVDDNLSCGGMNVTFRGVYTQSARPYKSIH